MCRVIKRLFVGRTDDAYQRASKAREAGIRVVQNSVREVQRQKDIALREAVGST